MKRQKIILFILALNRRFSISKLLNQYLTNNSDKKSYKIIKLDEIIISHEVIIYDM